MIQVVWIRKTHRYLGLVVGLQLLLWTVSGLYFSWNNIEEVRGENLVAEPGPLAPGYSAWLSPGEAITSLSKHTSGIETVAAVSLRPLLGSTVYEIKYHADKKARYALVDANSGEVRSPVGREEAVAIATADFVPEAHVLKTELIEESGGHSEYRGRELPAWRVEFDHPSGARIYVSADRGLVRARRNNTWRVFDFLWMFHIMDYETRDNINNLLLRVLSVLGLVTVISGYLLWGYSSRFIRRFRRTAAVPGLTIFFVLMGCAVGHAITLVDSGQNLGNGRTFSIAVGDLDGDLDLDIFVTDYLAGSRVLFNNGSGLFTDSGQSLGGATGHGVALGDLDGDDDLDAFVVFNAGVDRVYLNNGSGYFVDSGQSLGLTDDNGNYVYLGDIDNDDDLDALVHLYQKTNRVWVNDGSGIFSDLGQRLGGTSSGGMALGDLDSDGYLDIYLNNSSARDQVLLNDSTGTFIDSGQLLGPTGGHGHALMGDVDGDNDLDVFFTNSDNGSRVFLNNGLGILSNSGQQLGTGSQKLVLLDLDHDNDLDAITTHMQDGNPVWLNDGTGTFSFSGVTIDTTGVLSITAGNVDGDADLDILTGKLEGNGGNKLFFNETPLPVRSSSWGSIKSLFK